MSITITYIRENESDKTAFFKLNYNGETYEWHGDCPKEADPQIYFDDKEDELVFLILNKIYPEAQWQRFKTEENNRREAMEAWIEDGHRNIVGYDEEENPIYEVIENHPHKGTHPPQFGWIESIENATGLEETKAVIIQMLKDQI